MRLIINSSLRIFDAIKLLFKSPKSTLDFSKMMQVDIRTSAKYIKTLRVAGFDIQYKSNAFHIMNMPFKLNFKEDEMEGLLLFIFYMKEMFKENDDFEILYEKFINMTNYNPNKGRFLPSGFNLSKQDIEYIYKIKEYLNSNKINPLLIAHNNKKAPYVVLSVKYKNSFAYFMCFNLSDNKTYEINIKDIDAIEYSNEPVIRFLKKFYKTTFKLSLNLRKRYILKENERINYIENDALITNDTENKEELLNRLIRYGKNCEIMYPKSDREKMIEKLDELEKHFKKI